MTLSYPVFYKAWSLITSITHILGFASTYVFGGIWLWVWVVLVVGSFGVYIYQIPKNTHDLPFLIGYPNYVTLTRLIITFILLMNYENLTPEFLFFGFLLAVCLDGLDGYLARKLNQSSEIGSNLDMETDSFLVLAISYIHFSNGSVGWWIMIFGGLRYIYELAFFWTDKNKEVLPKKVRATIAVIFFISLIATFVLPQPVANWLLVISSCLIGLSFASSWIYKITYNE